MASKTTPLECSIDDLESLCLAPYAMRSADSAGRMYTESFHPYRGPFQRDRDRIVHSSAYRRLAHKTQVFTGQRGDYHRTRLTHTLEVASIARTVARTLRLNEDLVEALSLIHDIGHPPFGHAGEEVLDACLTDCGGFDHNAHATRIVTVLEYRYPEFPGLNLTQEVLSGQTARFKSERVASPTTRYPLLEVQVVDAADSVAYDSHDADDALELGLLRLEELLEVPLWREAARRVEQRYRRLDDTQFRRAVIHQIIDTLVSDLIQQTSKKLANAEIDDPEEATTYSERLVAPSPEISQQKAELEAFLFDRVYRHPTILAERKVAGAALREMFERYTEQPGQLPLQYQRISETDGIQRAVGDYLAAMTDRHALDEHQR